MLCLGSLPLIFYKWVGNKLCSVFYVLYSQMKASLPGTLPFCSYLDAEHPLLCADSCRDCICMFLLRSLLGFAASAAALLLEYGGNVFFFPTCLYSLLLIVRHNSDFSLNKGRPKHRHCVWDFWSRFPNACGDLKGGIRCDQPVLGTVAKKASVAHLHGRNCPHKYVVKYFHSTQIFCIRLCPVCLLPETCHLLGARAWAMLWDALQ